MKSRNLKKSSKKSRVKSRVKSNPENWVIYTMKGCSYCDKAKNALQKRKQKLERIYGNN